MCGGQLGCNLPPASHSQHEGVLRVIVSASYRTDIPAFYADWFMRRLAAGYCRVSNPYGGGDYEVLLTPEAVDGFVFWTRNMRPLLRHLEGPRRRHHAELGSLFIDHPDLRDPDHLVDAQVSCYR